MASPRKHWQSTPTISSTAVAALERGRRRAPRLSTLRQIARALDLDPDELAEMARAATAESGEALADISSDIEDGSVEEPLEIFPVAASSGTGALSPGELALPTAASRRWRTDFIGRDDELGQLVSAWEQRRRFNLVLGESGVEKARASQLGSRSAFTTTVGPLSGGAVARSAWVPTPRSSRSCVSWSRPLIR